MDRLAPLHLFIAAVEAGSFSAAARRLDVGAVQASATIARLEKELGTRLFERSTRRLRLTEAGEQWLPHARQLLAAWEAGQAALRGAGDAQPLSGRLRVSLPSDLGRQHLWRWIEDVAAAEGAASLQLELRLSDRLTDLVQEPVDHAVRYGEPPDSSLVALPLAPANRRVLCASPAYVARHGAPRTPSELHSHEALRFVLGDSLHGRWRFTSPYGETTVVDVSGSRIADDGGVVREWALAGLGIAYKSGLDVASDLVAGRLVALLPGWLGEPAPLHWMAVGRHRLTPALRRLAAALRGHCEALLPAQRPASNLTSGEPNPEPNRSAGGL
ncbi:LysR family transcriptional regulator [Roseateles cellulosilyticus]|uniref:LysR family transcriptional regulator n=1 Tax=Pelomonas cellulosilytica TaxID=2906762 RepID=A0ABS8XXD7_9BURK|nr:LysR family transcriptional regulator [Pelomonas sp. P8]MCE4555933.1 LysR family transcriptional regulator [Pelomonas sp. P8]